MLLFRIAPLVLLRAAESSLVFKSAFLPRALGVLVILAGCGGLTFLWPPLAKALWPRVIMMLDIGEFALMLWLVVKGVDVEPWHERACEHRSGRGKSD
jgi:hypothetical protein